MIPPEWLTEQTSIEEIEKLRIVDMLQLPPGYEVFNAHPTREPNEWYHQPAYATRPEFLSFKSHFRAGDEVWKYKAGNLWTDQTGMSGFAIKRNGHIITYMPTSYKL